MKEARLRALTPILTIGEVIIFAAEMKEARFRALTLWPKQRFDSPTS